jgi:hypothetical protein
MFSGSLVRGLLMEYLVKTLEQRWNRRKIELEESLANVPKDLRDAKIEVVYNRWFGILSSKELLNKLPIGPKVGEIFEDSVGKEIL